MHVVAKCISKATKNCYPVLYNNSISVCFSAGVKLWMSIAKTMRQKQKSLVWRQ